MSAATVALQLEMVRKYLPTLYPAHRVTVSIKYRYAWEKLWREKEREFWVAKPGVLDMFGTPIQGEVERIAKRVLRRWHWTDKSGRLRKVKEIQSVTILNIQDDPPITETKPSFREMRIPLRFA